MRPAVVERIIAVCWMCCIAAVAARAAPKPASDPIQIAIGGGAIDSAAFRWSSALAEILSRPPGLPDCDPRAPCGVPNVVASAQTYDDPQALLKALANGRVATAVMPAMRIYQARCAAPKGQAAAPITILKYLYRQPLRIVMRSDASIAEPKDFVGKAVAIGEHGSDSETVSLALLGAYGAPVKKVKLARLSIPLAVAALKNGSASAGIFIGHKFDASVAQLIGHGFTLLSLPDSPERQKLLRALPVFEADAIPPGSYPGLPAISTVAQPVVWAAGPGLDSMMAEKLVADLSEPHNLARITDLVFPVVAIPEGEAFLRLPAPAAPGVAQFAASRRLPVGLLDCPAVK